MTRHTIDTEFWYGQNVYLKVDPENNQGVVTEVITFGTPEVEMHKYKVRWPHELDTHYAMELSSEPNYGNGGEE